MNRLTSFAFSLSLLIVVANIIVCCTDSGHKGRSADIVLLDTIVEQGVGKDIFDSPEIADAMAIYMQIVGAPAAMPLTEAADSIRQTRWFQLFEADTQSRRAIFTDAERELGKAQNFLKTEFDSIAPIICYGIVSPYRQQVVIDRRRVFIVLNHYLGSDYPGYAGMPEYVRALKSPTQIAPDVTEAILASNYPMRTSAETLVLNRLLYEGAITWCVTKATGLPVGRVLGWDDEQTSCVEKQESRIWGELIKRDLIYSPDPSVAMRLTELAPATTLLSPDLPGRVGRYIGYRIVEECLRNNKWTPQQLLSPDFYDNPLTLVNSGYRG